MTPEVAILLLNLTVILCAYLAIYPKWAGSNMNKVSVIDVLLSGFVLVVVGSKFWGSVYSFSLIGFDTNWFWYTLITYGLLEIPMVIWYIKKHKVTL